MKVLQQHIRKISTRVLQVLQDCLLLIKLLLYDTRYRAKRIWCRIKTSQNFYDLFSCSFQLCHRQPLPDDPMRSFIPQGDKEKESLPNSNYKDGFPSLFANKDKKAPCAHAGTVFKLLITISNN